MAKTRTATQNRLHKHQQQSINANRRTNNSSGTDFYDLPTAYDSDAAGRKRR